MDMVRGVERAGIPSYCLKRLIDDTKKKKKKHP